MTGAFAYPVTRGLTVQGDPSITPTREINHCPLTDAGGSGTSEALTHHGARTSATPSAHHCWG